MQSMKKTILIVTSILALLSVSSRANQVTIDLGGGQLLTSSSAAVPDNMLVQLLADTTSTFGAPTAGSFTGTDANEIVLWSGTISFANSGIAGGFSSPVQLTLGQLGATEATGSFLMLRWYPTLTAAASSPGAGTSYGQFDDSNISTPDAASGSNIDWQIPATSASPYTLNYLSMSEGGDEANSAGVANLTTGAVPEPTTLSLMAGVMAVGAMVLQKRRK